MSLINDALKRAKETPPPAPPPIEPPPQPHPAEYPPHSSSGAVYLSMALLAIVVGTWLVTRGWTSTRGVVAGAAAQPVGAREWPADRDAAESADRAAAAVAEWFALEPAPFSPSNVERDFSVEDARPPAPTPVAEPPATAPVPTPAAAPPPTPAAPTPPSPPAFRLQAIFYRSANPTAMINGKTLGPGEQIDGARVISITRDTVTLQAQGETKVLTLN